MRLSLSLSGVLFMPTVPVMRSGTEMISTSREERDIGRRQNSLVYAKSKSPT